MGLGQKVSDRLALTVLYFCASESKMFGSPNADHREQDDVFEPGHHLWPQPAPQAEELRQGVQRPELSQGRGEHGRHRRAAEDDRQLPDPLHGQSNIHPHFLLSFVRSFAKTHTVSHSCVGFRKNNPSRFSRQWLCLS